MRPDHAGDLYCGLDLLITEFVLRISRVAFSLITHPNAVEHPRVDPVAFTETDPDLLGDGIRTRPIVSAPVGVSDRRSRMGLI